MPPPNGQAGDTAERDGGRPSSSESEDEPDVIIDPAGTLDARLSMGSLDDRLSRMDAKATADIVGGSKSTSPEVHARRADEAKCEPAANEPGPSPSPVRLRRLSGVNTDDVTRLALRYTERQRGPGDQRGITLNGLEASGGPSTDASQRQEPAQQRSMATMYQELLEEDPELMCLVEEIKSAGMSHNGIGKSFVKQKRRNLRKVLSQAAWIVAWDSPLKAVWDLLVACAILTCAIVTPLMIANFGGTYGSATFVALNATFVAVFIADLAIKMRTSFMQEGAEVRDPRAIAKLYVGSVWFYVDLVAALPLGLLMKAGCGGAHCSAVDAFAMQGVKCLRVFKASGTGGRAHPLTHLTSRIDPAIMRIMKLAFILVIAWHWMGCSWWYVSGMELRPPISAEHNPWHPTEELLAAPAAQQWIHSIYWALRCSVSAEVPGEPETALESSLTALFIVAGVCIDCTLIGLVASALSNIDPANRKRQEKLEAITAYMRYKRVPQRLRERMHEYFDYVFSTMSGLDEAKLFQEIPVSLRRQLGLAMNRKLFTHVPLFKFCDVRCILSLVDRLSPMIFMPGDFVVREGEPGRALYFINRGSVNVLKPREPTGPVARGARARRLSDTSAVPTQLRGTARLLKVLKERAHAALGLRSADVRRESGVKTAEAAVARQLSEGEFFGEQSLLQRTPCSSSARTTTFCELMALWDEDFHAVIKDFPQFADLVAEISRQLQVGDDAESKASSAWGTSFRRRSTQALKGSANAAMRGDDSPAGVGMLRRSLSRASMSMTRRIVVDESTTAPSQGRQRPRRCSEEIGASSAEVSPPPRRTRRASFGGVSSMPGAAEKLTNVFKRPRASLAPQSSCLRTSSYVEGSSEAAAAAEARASTAADASAAAAAGELVGERPAPVCVLAGGSKSPRSSPRVHPAPAASAKYAVDGGGGGDQNAVVPLAPVDNHELDLGSGGMVVQIDEPELDD